VIVFLLLLFAVIILLEVPGLVKKKMWRELAAFSLYVVIGMGISIPLLLGIKLPNPNKTVEALFKPLSELLKNTRAR